MLRLVIRGYLKKVRQWESSVEVWYDKMPSLMCDLADQHVKSMLGGTLDMVEIEFLDEPDVMQRFLRLGTNPDGMVMPIEIEP
jgi:hypothetical protein